MTTLDNIDAAIAAHEAGGAHRDLDVSADAMRWTPGTDTPPGDEPFFTDADIIDVYTRAQAIRDGVLAEVPTPIAREAGFRFPVAITGTAWRDCVAWTDADTDHTGIPQEQDGRLGDVLWMAKQAIRSAPQDFGIVQVRVELYRVSRDSDTGEPERVELVVACGPGDEAEPVITIMFPHED